MIDLTRANEMDTTRPKVASTTLDTRGENPEQRLRNALHELKNRGEAAADDVRAVTVPLREWRTFILAGLGAVVVVAAIRAVARRPSRPRRSAAARVGRSLVAELATRAALGAAGVVGAYVASELILPALTRRLASQNPTTKKSRPAKSPAPSGE